MVDYLLKHTDYNIYGCLREFNIHNYSNIIHIDSKRFYLIIFDLLDILYDANTSKCKDIKSELKNSNDWNLIIESDERNGYAIFEKK